MTTPDQLLLLRAATGEAESALPAWAEWKQRVGLDRAEHASQRLLPLVYRNLVRLGADDPELPKLKGLYRHAWYRNQLLFNRTGEILHGFREAGIETLVLKGVALSLLHYRDNGARPMEDVDILVRPERAADAIDLLGRAGWTPAEPVPAFLEVKHAHPFRDDAGYRLDLHWNALWEAAPDDDLWLDSVPLEVNGEPTRALDPTDQLLHVCVHGVQWDPTPSIRWIADAITVLGEDAVDWDRLVERGRARRLTVGLGASLGFLRAAFDAPVPVRVLDALAATKPARHERLGHRAKSWRGGLTRRLILNWDRHRRLAALYPEYSRVSFFRFQQQFGGVERARHMPRLALEYALTHWRKRLGGRSA